VSSVGWRCSVPLRAVQEHALSNPFGLVRREPRHCEQCRLEMLGAAPRGIAQLPGMMPGGSEKQYRAISPAVVYQI